MSSRIVRGKYVPGCGHSRHRPLFYAKLRLRCGTLNMIVEAGTEQSILIPITRVPGCDPIDFDQDFLIRPCFLKQVGGYQILPVTKSTNKLAGHHAEGIIEIALFKTIDVKPGDELEVELQDYEDEIAVND